MKKALCWILGILAAVCLAIGCIWGGEIATIRSISPVAGNKYLYRMEYKAAYDLDDVITQDIDENAKLLDYVVGRIGKGLPIKMKSAQVADERGDGDAQLHLLPGPESRRRGVLFRPQLRLFQEPHDGDGHPSPERLRLHRGQRHVPFRLFAGEDTDVHDGQTELSGSHLRAR